MSQIRVHTESLIAMERVSYQQLVILLAFFQLIVSSNAIPSTSNHLLLVHLL